MADGFILTAVIALSIFPDDTFSSLSSWYKRFPPFYLHCRSAIYRARAMASFCLAAPSNNRDKHKVFLLCLKREIRGTEYPHKHHESHDTKLVQRCLAPSKLNVAVFISSSLEKSIKPTCINQTLKYIN
jgi:hypothetical protein